MPRKIWWAVAVVLASGFAWYAAGHPMDFRVYYHGAQGVFDGTRPVYGDRSGLGWPMHYRYPPLFLFFAAPFTWLSLPSAAAIWAVLKCAALALLGRALWSRLGSTGSAAAVWIPVLLAGPYVVEDIRFGNAQGFIFALTGAALLTTTAAPRLAAAALALAISIKVWPLYFVPFLAIRREWKTAAWTLIFSAALLLLPSLYFGFEGNLNLMAEWTRQEFATQTGQSEIWFPSQSLRGVLMRYLTVIDYSQVPDSNYRLVNVAAFDPGFVRWLWMILAGAGYAGLLALTARTRKHSSLLPEALAFTTLILFQPFSQKYALVVLLWPAMAAARTSVNRWKRGVLFAAAGLAVVQPLVSGAAAQRLMQVLGFDFLVTALLAAFLTIILWKRPT